MSDDDIAKLSSKEIKNIRKIYAPKIKFKSKSKAIKWSGSQKIKITGTGDFYIEEMECAEPKLEALEIMKTYTL